MIKTGPIIFFLAFVFSIELIGQEDFSSESELKAKANELFDESKYVEAAPLFSQLLSLYPKEVEYNYKYGASLIYADDDKSKSIKYLQFAVSKSTVDPLAHYFLGYAHHLNYSFSKAIRHYNRFKARASNSLINELAIDRKIEMCKNGSDLLANVSEVQVVDKKVVPKENFFRSYRLDGVEGKIITKPEAFQSKEDKKVNDKSVIYLPDGASEVVYPSYGRNGDQGLDLYKVVKLGNGSWSEPVRLGDKINTPYDENYAFIHPNGKTLYFSSKGHNSMGGYDLFKSEYDSESNEWSAPQNLGFAFSSTSDDILFVTDQSAQLAYFASNRNNVEGELTIYKVLTNEKPLELSVIQGELIYESTNSKPKATITVLNQKTNQPVGVYETKENGKYQIELPSNGGTYKYNIETSKEAPIHTGVIEVPRQDEFKVLAQELRLVGSGDDQKLVIKNIFDGSRANQSQQDGPLVSSTTLVEKAKLSVNANESAAAEPSDQVSLVEGTINEKTQQIENQLKEGDKQVDLAFNKAMAYKNEADEAFNQAQSQSAEQAEETLKKAKELSLKALVTTQLAQSMNEALNDQKSIYNELVRTNQQEGNTTSNQKAESLIADYRSAASLNAILANESSQLNSEVSALTNNIDRQDKKINALRQDKQSVEKRLQETEETLSQASSSSEKAENEAELNRLQTELNDLKSQINRSIDEKEALRKDKLVNETTLKQIASLSADFENKSKLNNQNQLNEQEVNELLTSVKKYRDQDLLFTDESEEKEKLLASNSAKESNDQGASQAREEGSNQQSMSADENSSSNSLTSGTSNNRSSNDFSSLEFQPSKENTSNSPKLNEANQALVEAKQYHDQAESLSQEVYSLETAEQRNEAFSKINEFEKKSKEKQIEAASKFAEANKEAYFKNSEVLLKANNFSEEFNSSNLDMANLMAEEAEVYFSQAREIRYSIEADERFSKQIVDLQKAYDYEVLALNKQNKAIQLLNKVDEEYEDRKVPASSPIALNTTQVKMVQTIDNPEVLKVKEAEVAQNKADELVQESKQLKKEADSIQTLIANTSDQAEKEKHIKAFEVIEKKRTDKEQLADLYYKRKIQIENGYADASSMEKVGAGINKPMTTAVSIDVDTVNINESRKQAILNSKDYNTYLKEAQKNHRLKKRSKVDYENAKMLQIAQQDFNLKASALRNQALETSDAEKRDRLVKEAEVLEQKALDAQKSIDSVSKIIKLRNYMIQQSDRSLNQQLAWIEDEDRGLLVYLANKNIENEVPDIDTDVDELAAIDEGEDGDFLANSDRELVETVITPKKDELTNEEQPSEAENNSEPIVNNDDEGSNKQEINQVKEDNPNVVDNQEQSTRPPKTSDAEKDQGATNKQTSKQTREPRAQIESIPRRVNATIFNRLSPSESAYSRSQPIPLVDEMPEGLVYKVQVGAFRNPIPQNMFKGFAPIMAQESPNGITRYTAGFFLNEGEAVNARDNIRELGYKDAFVVAYLNGERIGMSQARAYDGNSTSPSSSTTSSTVAENYTKVDNINDVFFTVQIGVFSNPIEGGTFSEFEPLNVALLPNGMRRYNSGVYRTAQEAEAAKTKINTTIKDAFVTAYYQGKRISLNEAARLMNR